MDFWPMVIRKQLVESKPKEILICDYQIFVPHCDAFQFSAAVVKKSFFAL